jgi:hypothetical protein
VGDKKYHRISANINNRPDEYQKLCQMVLEQMKLDLQLPETSGPITTYVVSSNLDQGDVYNIMW